VIGHAISHYRIIERLGAGGMGVVYKAEDTKLGRQVALKVLSDELLKDPHAIERFQREARAASALNHPNICTIYEIDEDNGTPFLVMELLKGQTVKERLEQGPLPKEMLIEVAIEFADALAAAHEARIIHRDLKPANLFLTRPGHLKILDFGLAKVLAEQRDDASRAATAARDLTASDTTLGTVAYMSPEQARGQALDARTDLFSFGAVLYELATGTRAFAGSTAANIYDAILHEEAPPMGGGHAGLEPIVRKALEKDRELRYQSAADIRADLKRLKHDSAPTVQSAAVSPKHRRTAFPVVAAAVAVAVLAGVALWRTRGTPTHSPTRQITIAVLPFANLAGNRDRDYLRLAVPDELITILSHSPSLAVRPFAMTRKFTGDVDPQQTGRSLSVTNVITGDYRESAGRIRLTAEAIDVEKNNVIWRDSVEVPAEDLIAMRNELANRVRAGLLPRLNATADAQEPSRPRNDEAYALFLRAAATPFDPLPNKQALAILERAVRLDDSYAPAWTALAVRSYYDAQYADGGDEAIKQAAGAHRKALAIDPDQVVSARGLIIIQTESGDLQGAYRQARDLVRRRPESGDAHFSLSYTLRYGGLPDEAARECDVARSLDPTNRGLRSCALAFMQLGDDRRALEFAQLDGGSAWANSIRVQILLRQGRREEALRLAESTTTVRDWRLLEAIVRQRPQNEIDRLVATLKETTLAVHDGENAFFGAGVMALLKRDREALDLLRFAGGRNFCAYPAVDRDPSFAGIRTSPQFREIRQAAIDCQARFLSFRQQQAP
jgi:serine/threonine protein kinase/tetratricopeptide (TPR) repeat protein